MASAARVNGETATQISVSVVTYNNAECLPGFLDSLRRQQGVTWEAFFFDNGSHDSTGDLIRAAELGELFVSATNIGYGRAHNDNARRARGKYLLILNPDLSFNTDLFATLASHAERSPELSFLGPRILEGSTPRPFPPRRFYPGEGMIALDPAWRREEIAWLNGCCFLVNRAAFAKLGGFDTDYFLYQAEADLCLRARRAGYRLGHAGDAVVYHAHRESQRDLSEYEYSRRIFEGNAVFLKKHFAAGDVIQMLRFQVLICGVLLSLNKLRERIPLPQHLLSDARLRARRDVCVQLVKGSQYKVWSPRSAYPRIAARQFRLLFEWIRQRKFPIDDY
jgi:N-acetylglucosaminyl-diphospho-decaprenol L-rhamnosyltransferase